MTITFTLSSLHKRAAKRPVGYVSDVLSHATVVGDKVTLTQESYAQLAAKYRKPRAAVVPSAQTSGPGTELKALLKTIGITAKPNCSCNKRAKIMDEKGCDWCEENIDEIDGWLAEESKKRNLPYLSLAGKTLIRLAIRRARKKGNSK